MRSATALSVASSIVVHVVALAAIAGVLCKLARGGPPPGEAPERADVEIEQEFTEDRYAERTSNEVGAARREGPAVTSSDHGRLRSPTPRTQSEHIFRTPTTGVRRHGGGSPTLVGIRPIPPHPALGRGERSEAASGSDPEDSLRGPSLIHANVLLSGRGDGLGEDDVYDWNTSSDDMGPYFRRLRSKIDPLWANAFPKSAMLELKQGTVVLEFVVDTQGRAVVTWPPLRPSGINEFDRNCAEAIRRASPFEPIPAFLGRTHIRIRAPFEAVNPIVR